MTTNHTPTPWAVDASKYSVSIMAGRFCVAQTATAQTGNVAPAEENAAFIVRACNAHDELVAALCAVDQADALAADKAERDHLMHSALIVVRAALAKEQR